MEVNRFDDSLDAKKAGKWLDGVEMSEQLGDVAARPNSPEIEVGVHIRKLRESLGVTISELAQSASISAGMLFRIENG